MRRRRGRRGKEEREGGEGRKGGEGGKGRGKHFTQFQAQLRDEKVSLWACQLWDLGSFPQLQNGNAVACWAPQSSSNRAR